MQFASSLPDRQAMRPSDQKSPQGRKTRLLRTGSQVQAEAKTVAPPLQRGSTVLLPDARSLYDYAQTSYGRLGLSMQAALAEAIGELEGGEPARLFPSGLAAIAGTLQALLQAGDELLVVGCASGPARRFCDHILKRYGVSPRNSPSMPPTRSSTSPIPKPPASAK